MGEWYIRDRVVLWQYNNRNYSAILVTLQITSYIHTCRCNTTKEFSIAFYVKFKKIELSYRIHLKFNLSDTHISWKGCLIGSLTLKINIHLMAYKKQELSLKKRCTTKHKYYILLRTVFHWNNLNILVL